MRENCTSGSARGVPGNRHSYRRGSRHQGKAKARHPSPPPAWHGIGSFWIAWYWLILDSMVLAESRYYMLDGLKRRCSCQGDAL
jgi:hypothetical protein